MAPADNPLAQLHPTMPRYPTAPRTTAKVWTMEEVLDALGAAAR